MSNFHDNHSGFHNGFNQMQKPSAFKIWHANNHSETVISMTDEFCKVVQNAILSNYCDNKALVAFAKQLFQYDEPRSRNMDGGPHRRPNLNYGRNDYDNNRRRGHHADVEDYLDDF